MIFLLTCDLLTLPNNHHKDTEDESPINPFSTTNTQIHPEQHLCRVTVTPQLTFYYYSPIRSAMQQQRLNAQNIHIKIAC